MRTRVSAALLALLILLGVSRPLQAQDQDEGMRTLLDVVERVAQAGDAAAYLGLLADSADRGRARDFAASELIPGATRVVVKERDRLPLAGTLPGNGYRLWVDAFAEFGSRSRVATWRVDVRRVTEPGGGGREWAIADQERVTSVESIYRLSLNPAKQFTARNLKLSAEDLDVTLADGSVFVADIDQGVTGLVLIGHGTFNFHPAPEMEKGQVKIFCGRETLDAGFDAAYIRLHPSDFDGAVVASQLLPAAVDPRDLRRAQDVFREESQKSFAIDLGDLSRDAWTLLPQPGDFLAELRTKKYDTLTYAKSSTEAEDITLFDRKRHHNISIYASKDRLAQRGRFYNEDDLVDYDVLHYDVEVAATPDRMWIDGRTIVRLKVKAPILGAITMRLADPLTVQSIISYEYGRLFYVRVKNQNTLVINLPTPVARDTQITLTISYAGRLEPQTPDRETIAMQQAQRVEGEDVAAAFQAEPSYLYSNRSYWYPQATVTDYATATLRITVPASLECVASGELEPGFPALLPGTTKDTKDLKDLSQRRKVYQFSASQPLRYLAFIVSRFMRAETVTLALPMPERENPIVLTGISYHSLNLSVETNPRQVQRGHDLVERAGDIASFYSSLIGDSPYSSFTIALVENDLPGGHSPAYFAALNQPLPSSTLSWRNDPASFTGFNDFFLAHELAHQWWGQAVGGRNYHEQWLSEGFAQYFAALYAQHERGDELFASVLKQLRRWAMDESKQGPVYLGYRLGHIRNESRVFRALVYNKGAAVLHMLRRLVGDEKFFAGLRRFYASSRFHKVGTEDLRAAMETESGRSLERFFEQWIYGTQLAKLKFSYRVEGSEVVLHAEQVGDVFDVPLTVTLQYADKKSVDVVLPVTERSVDVRVTLTGTLRGVEIKEDGTLAEISKR
ncbi:MAG: hypothetical protein LAO77_24705 [Acidobacteriia bacterium]|nr:hypothetical protein [Terriglobia bacterium]